MVFRPKKRNKQKVESKVEKVKPAIHKDPVFQDEHNDIISDTDYHPFYLDTDVVPAKTYTPLSGRIMAAIDGIHFDRSKGLRTVFDNFFFKPWRGPAQDSYLSSRADQEKEFLLNGYDRKDLDASFQDEDYNNGKYGLLKYDLPIYQTAKDAISRDDLVPISRYDILEDNRRPENIKIDRNKELQNAGNYPGILYLDGKTGNPYIREWDINNYSGTNTRKYSAIENVGLSVLDLLGSPIIQTTGFQPLGQNKNIYYISKYVKGSDNNPQKDKLRKYKEVEAENVFKKFVPFDRSVLRYDKDEQNLTEQNYLDNGDRAHDRMGIYQKSLQDRVKRYMASIGQQLTDMGDDTMGYTLPEVVVTPKQAYSNKVELQDVGKNVPAINYGIDNNSISKK